MKQQRFVAGSVRAANQAAGEQLSQNGNRLFLIEALTVCLLFVSVYVLLDYACMAALMTFEDWGTAAYLTVALFCLTLFAVTLFLVLPTLIGLCSLAEQIHRGEKPVLADLFRFFATRERYVLSLALSIRFLWRLTLVATAVRVTAVLCTTFLPPEFWSILLCAVLISVEILAGIIRFLCEFPMLYLCLRHGDGADEAGERAAQLLCKSPVRHAARFFIVFLPQLLLGLLTFGVLLIADTIPRMLIAYFEYCESALCCAPAEKDLD